MLTTFSGLGQRRYLPWHPSGVDCTVCTMLFWIWVGNQWCAGFMSTAGISTKEAHQALKMRVC